MKIGLLQSSYLPWLGFFDQIAKSEIFIFYDDVQFEEGSWRNRNRIKTKTGWSWLTVPVYKTGHFGQKIHEVKINNTIPWQKKHLRAIYLNYHQTPYFGKYYHDIEKVLEQNWEFLSELNVELITYFCRVLGINTKLMSSITLNNITGQKTDRIYSICRGLSADEIIVGAKAKNYLDEQLLTESGIKIEYQEYRHPQYMQLYPPFIPYLSIIDLLFTEGDNSLEILYDKNGGIIVNSGETK